MITAAHCFTPEKPPKRFAIIPGLHNSRITPNRRFNGPIHKIWAMYVPKKWDAHKLSHDIAILVMTEPFEFNDNVKPIAMDYNSHGIRGIIKVFSQFGHFVTLAKLIDSVYFIQGCQFGQLVSLVDLIDLVIGSTIGSISSFGWLGQFCRFDRFDDLVNLVIWLA